MLRSCCSVLCSENKEPRLTVSKAGRTFFKRKNWFQSETTEMNPTTARVTAGYPSHTAYSLFQICDRKFHNR